MPYSLNFTSGGTVSFTPKSLMGTWAWEIELEIPDTATQRVINFNNSNFRDLRAVSGFWELRNGSAGLPNVTSTSAAVTNTRTVVRVEANSDEVSWFIDGTPQGVIGTQTNDFILNDLNKTSNFTGKVYRFEVWENGILVESRVKQALTSGDDRVYTDNVGTNDGALDATFPTDNSQWELFDAAAGVAADIAYTVSSPSFSASASASLPQPVSDISYTVSTPSFSVAADASLPNPIANANVTVSAPLFIATGSATIPNINASASFDVSAPEFSATASATLPNPVGDVSFDVVAPSFSVSASATITGNVAACLIDLEAPQFSASAQATFPQPDCDIDFTTSAPTFSVVAFAGGNAIIKVEGKTIELPYRSRAVYLTEG